MLLCGAKRGAITNFELGLAIPAAVAISDEGFATWKQHNIMEPRLIIGTSSPRLANANAHHMPAWLYVTTRGHVSTSHTFNKNGIPVSGRAAAILIPWLRARATGH